MSAEYESQRDKRLEQALTKSELVAYITANLSPHIPEADVELAVSSILERMMTALMNGERIEVRGFGSISLHYRPPRLGRNPKTGEDVRVPEKYVPHFKPGVNLRKRVNKGNNKGSSV